MDAAKGNHLIEQGQFIGAYELLINELSENPKSVAVVEISKKLSAQVRSRCMDLACNKATEMSAETHECEALLRLIIKLNGETIYG